MLTSRVPMGRTRRCIGRNIPRSHDVRNRGQDLRRRRLLVAQHGCRSGRLQCGDDRPLDTIDHYQHRTPAVPSYDLVPHPIDRGVHDDHHEPSAPQSMGLMHPRHESPGMVAIIPLRATYSMSLRAITIPGTQ